LSVAATKGNYMYRRDGEGPSPPVLDDAAAMAAHGIERVSVEWFHWNGYRYGALKDALAAARRAAPKSEGSVRA